MICCCRHLIGAAQAPHRPEPPRSGPDADSEALDLLVEGRGLEAQHLRGLLLDSPAARKGRLDQLPFVALDRLVEVDGSVRSERGRRTPLGPAVSRADLFR